jgi:hypothetical protein
MHTHVRSYQVGVLIGLFDGSQQYDRYWIESSARERGWRNAQENWGSIARQNYYSLL